MSEKPILFFDGDCGFCNRTVRWIIRRDRHARIRFAPLQGSTYANLNLPGKPPDMTSIVLLKDDRLYVRTAASVRVLWTIGGFSAVLGTLQWLIPLPIRDACYRWIAKRRHKLLSMPAACDLPSVTARERFLA